MAVDDEDRLRFVSWTGRPLTMSGSLRDGIQPPRLMNWSAQNTFSRLMKSPRLAIVRPQPSIAVEIPNIATDAAKEAEHWPV